MRTQAACPMAGGLLKGLLMMTLEQLRDLAGTLGFRLYHIAELDHGAVVTDERMATRTPGLFCAEDVRRTPLRQIITAAADGAMAATSASAYLGNPVDY